MLVPLYDENPTTRWPVVTVTIISVNALILIAAQGLDSLRLNEIHARYGFVPGRLQQLQDRELVIPVDITPTEEGANPGFERIQVQPDYFVKLKPYPHQILMSLVTSMFLHAGWVHFLGNMWIFWVYGNNIEDRLGHVPFVLFYIAGGIVASLCHWLMAPVPDANVPVIGASGAVAAVLGAYAVTYPKHHIRCLLFLCLPFLVRLPALVVLGLWIVGQLVSALATTGLVISGNVAWWAHIGGFLVGAVTIPLLTMIIPAPATPPPAKHGDILLTNKDYGSAEGWKRSGVKHNDPRIPRHDSGIRWLDE